MHFQRLNTLKKPRPCLKSFAKAAYAIAASYRCGTKLHYLYEFPEKCQTSKEKQKIHSTCMLHMLPSTACGDLLPTQHFYMLPELFSGPRNRGTSTQAYNQRNQGYRGLNWVLTECLSQSTGPLLFVRIDST